VWLCGCDVRMRKVQGWGLEGVGHQGAFRALVESSQGQER
jgi:hypothetical protein